MGDNTPKLGNILDLSYLKKLQVSFSEITGITADIRDAEGDLLTDLSNKYGLCAWMHQTEEGVRRCREVCVRLSQQSGETGKTERDICPFSGFSLASIPFIFNGRHVASWMLGQFRLEELDTARVEEMSRDLGLDPGELREMLERTPKLTPAEFDQAKGFLEVMIGTLVRLAQKNYAISEKNDELESMASQLDNAAQMMRKFMEFGDVGMYVADYHTGELLMANSYYAQLLGVAADEMVGLKCWTLTDPDAQTFCANCPRQDLLTEDGKPGGPISWENYNMRFNLWLRCSLQTIRWVDGRLACMITFYDITRERAMRDQLASLAYYDPQMGMPNAYKLLHDLDEAQQTMETGQFLVCFDIATLRRLNNAYGRAIGDELLQMTAHWVRDLKVPNSELYRIEGDEFCLRMRNASFEKAAGVARAIHERFQHFWPIHISNKEFTIYSGVWVSVLGIDEDFVEDENVPTLIERTLDVARRENRIVIYNKEMDMALKTHSRLEISLKACVEKGMVGFTLQYQPIVDPATGRWKALEALSRWTSPALGPVSPSVFIPESEKLGLIPLVGQWALDTAVRECKQLKLDEQEGFVLSVNVSPIEITESHFVAQVFNVLDRHRYPGEKLNLEVTESTAFTFDTRTEQVMRQLRERNIKIALDDFGTGYSSFNTLKNLPVDYLKTEQTFVRDIENDSYLQYFLYTMAELAHAADKKLVAEGVETPRQLAIVLRNGADYVQGNFFSPPLTFAQLRRKLSRFRIAAPTVKYQGGKMHVRQLLEDHESYSSSPHLFRILSRCVKLLLTEPSIPDSFTRVVELVGRQLNLIRTHVYLQKEGSSYSCAYSWSAEGIEPMSALMPVVDIEGFPLPISLTGAGAEDPQSLVFTTDGSVQADTGVQFTDEGSIAVADIRHLSKHIIDRTRTDSLLAMVVTPMWHEDTLIGFMGFDSDRYRDWRPAEITMLQNLAMVMSTLLRKESRPFVRPNRDKALIEMYDQLPISMFVSDLETDRVLWTNKLAREGACDNLPVKGRKCHEAFYGFKTRCPFCRLHELGTSPGGDGITWERYNEENDRYYLVQDNIIRWEDGKPAHLGYQIDITQTKRNQMQLEYYAITDLMTGAYTRNHLMTLIPEVLENAELENEPVTVAFIDIDKLKYANDTYGHSFGDMLINNTAKILLTFLEEEDIIGRYGGDEFLLLFRNKSRGQVETLLRQARSTLKHIVVGEAKEDFSFSYGVAESTELGGINAAALGQQLLDIADERMRRYKHATVESARVRE